LQKQRKNAALRNKMSEISHGLAMSRESFKIKDNSLYVARDSKSYDFHFTSHPSKHLSERDVSKIQDGHHN
jgi:hypothetical protein